MIVVDTNIIAYFYLPTDFSADTEQLLTLSPNWAAPSLWRSEFRSILTQYLRKNLLDLDTASQIQAQAERLLTGNEYTIDSLSVLTLANSSQCSAYDCEFVALAKQLDTKLITADKKILNNFPDIAITTKSYIATFS